MHAALFHAEFSCHFMIPHVKFNDVAIFDDDADKICDNISSTFLKCKFKSHNLSSFVPLLVDIIISHAAQLN